jgi:hypothetical protein
VAVLVIHEDCVSTLKLESQPPVPLHFLTHKNVNRMLPRRGRFRLSDRWKALFEIEDFSNDIAANQSAPIGRKDQATTGTLPSLVPIASTEQSIGPKAPRGPPSSPQILFASLWISCGLVAQVIDRTGIVGGASDASLPPVRVIDRTGRQAYQQILFARLWTNHTLR